MEGNLVRFVDGLVWLKAKRAVNKSHQGNMVRFVDGLVRLKPKRAINYNILNGGSLAHTGKRQRYRLQAPPPRIEGQKGLYE